MPKHKVVLVISTILVTIWTSKVLAADLSETLLPDGTWKITIDGELKGGDQIRFDRFLFIERPGKVSSVHLNSPGGLVSEGYALAREIEDQGITTVVERGSHCESACFLVFIAGSRKIASVAARIGIHRGSRNGVDDEEVTNEVIDYVYKLGPFGSREERLFNRIAYNLYKTASDRMNYIPPDELINLGVEIRY